MEFYSPLYFHSLLNFELPPDQHQFTALPKEVLDTAIADPSMFPITVVHKENPVGFFVLHYRSAKVLEYTQNPNAVLLSAFSINYKDQGKGFAKQTLTLLPHFVKINFQGVDDIVLGVNQRNLVAKSLYIKVGFQDRGEIKIGKKGPQHVLHYPLE
ncbi:MAG: GNAT family N-acetyltransferase [Alicyclobacillus macrosporangiidus]|nr:GNAT family N-acetyltransferase [Alicyclobacillus macrosporangiidus]